MNCQYIKENICRICLDENGVLDWNAPLYADCNTTYKACYFKYTQLQCTDNDTFSSMLCKICLNDLQSVHSFILKALESHKYFEETNLIKLQTDYSSIAENDAKYTPTEFETVLVEKIEVEPMVQDDFVDENIDEEFQVEQVRSKNISRRSKRECTLKISENSIKIENQTEQSITDVEIIDKCSLEQKLPQSLRTFCTKSRRKPRGKSKSSKQISDEDNDIQNRLRDESIDEEQYFKEETFLDDKMKDDAQVVPKVRKKYVEKKTPTICSICSRILHSVHAVRRHEKTHMKNRERKETCKVCGLKFYDKSSLHCHMRIHKENREKNHKCEFCDKAFYNKGGLNVHRRIHLGQMIPCSLCSKQYFRQVELDIHMRTHSATAINAVTKKKSRYFVRCQHCDKSILSTRYKSHNAAHLNEPLMKCAICSKEFFRRGSCVTHIKTVHQKGKEEYNEFIIQYTKHRISHLFLEQNADILSTDE